MNRGLGSSILVPLLLCGVTGSCAPALMVDDNATGMQNTVRSTGPIAFRKVTLTTHFIAEGVAIGDINDDGKPDVVAGSFWFEGPNWRRHALGDPKVFDPAFTESRGEYSDTFINFLDDVDADGHVDIIRIGFPGSPAYWLKNPGTKHKSWPSMKIYPAVGNESPLWIDLKADGTRGLLFGDFEEHAIGFIVSISRNDQVKWVRTLIREGGVEGGGGMQRYAHGLGLADVNGDGRRDILVENGWYESPASEGNLWQFHGAEFSINHSGCAQMYAFDFDADGDNDVVCSTPHNYGLWWIENAGGRPNEAQWIRHLIADHLSQGHSLAMADVDGDGLPDLVTGKRYGVHFGFDPGSDESSSLYWYRLTRESNGAPTWTPLEIDDESGSGVQLAIGDVNLDGRLDIVTSNRNGVFVFEQVDNP